MATERMSADEALARLPQVESHLPVLLDRIRPHVELRPGSRVLDLGAAQGVYVAALAGAGFEAYGVEPWAEAIRASVHVSRSTGRNFEVIQGTGESLPFDSEFFDLVIATSVMEHVEDPEAVFAEAWRILRPGGGFHFYTTSALCPRQAEIRVFPFFPWYPNRVRVGTMRWATERHPWLVNHTEMPAYHWFTPWGARRSLAAAGFTKVLDRWELKRVDELRGPGRMAFRAARSFAPLKFVGDVLIPESAYLAVR